MTSSSIIHSNPRLWKILRKQVLIRDQWKCRVHLPGCTEAATTVDHIISRMDGGSDDLSNLQAACRRCNLKKGGVFLGSNRFTDASHQKLPPLLKMKAEY